MIASEKSIKEKKYHEIFVNVIGQFAYFGGILIELRQLFAGKVPTLCIAHIITQSFNCFNHKRIFLQH